jgi:hypothetical protein
MASNPLVSSPQPNEHPFTFSDQQQRLEPDGQGSPRGRVRSAPMGVMTAEHQAIPLLPGRGNDLRIMARLRAPSVLVDEAFALRPLGICFRPCPGSAQHLPPRSLPDVRDLPRLAAQALKVASVGGAL